MIAVLHGQGDWDPAERRHLAECADCGAEWKVVSAAHAAGDRHRTPVNVEAIVGQLHRRLASGEAAPRESMGGGRWVGRAVRWGALLAAAVLLMVWLGIRRAPPSRQPPAVAAAPFVLHELDSLTPGELQRVLETVGSAVPTVGGAEPLMGELSTEELETILHSLEG
jgi:hypothetical protein